MVGAVTSQECFIVLKHGVPRVAQLRVPVFLKGVKTCGAAVFFFDIRSGGVVTGCITRRLYSRWPVAVSINEFLIIPKQSRQWLHIFCCGSLMEPKHALHRSLFVAGKLVVSFASYT